ncbi:hypothetical protein ACHAQI_011214 [Fusarium lateritium]
MTGRIQTKAFMKNVSSARITMTFGRTFQPATPQHLSITSTSISKRLIPHIMPIQRRVRHGRRHSHRCFNTKLTKLDDNKMCQTGLLASCINATTAAKTEAT